MASHILIGELPAGLGQGVMRMASWRVARYEQLPEAIRRYLEQQARLWINPPKDLAEIRTLQN